jgi:hypothetical protein
MENDEKGSAPNLNESMRSSGLWPKGVDNNQQKAGQALSSYLDTQFNSTQM